MNFVDKHKALFITILLAGIIVLVLFSVHITKQNEFIAESFYPLEPEELKDEKEVDKNKGEIETNNAVNEDDEFKEMMKNFKSVNSTNFEKQITETTPKTESENLEENTVSSTIKSTKNYTLNAEELSLYENVKHIISEKTQKEKPVKPKANSTYTYSLKDRTLQDFETPIYLCEVGGKIVINITVNSSGKVTDTYVNTSSTSKNECLTDHAIEYAKAVQFNYDATQNEQLGSITFYFIGK